MNVLLTPTQANTLLRLQCDMNAKVDPTWVGSAHPYLRAVVIEAAEAIEHHGWKWWKKQLCDLPQLQMELVDIWHFLLSEILLRESGDQTEAAKALHVHLQDCSNTTVSCDGQTFDLSLMSVLEKLQLLIALSSLNRIELNVFAHILHDCQMAWDELYRQYVGKNVLNFFRQDHGYKEGSYRKVWNGREDNEHLVELMTSLPQDAENYPEQLYIALQQRYLD
jgi:dimeric dUTPase (all-alpha-NTP-PPase superfamily)